MQDTGSGPIMTTLDVVRRAKWIGVLVWIVTLSFMAAAALIK